MKNRVSVKCRNFVPKRRRFGTLHISENDEIFIDEDNTNLNIFLCPDCKIRMLKDET